MGEHATGAEGKQPPVLFETGFRPFFLLAAAMAVSWTPVWVLAFTGRLALPSHLGPLGWHAHEMVFGFAVAVIAGFLLTAVIAWTKQPTTSGAGLAALASLWLAGRLVMPWSATLPAALVAVIDISFLPALAFVIARPILRARNTRNAPFIALLLALAACNMIVHLGAFGVAAERARAALLASVDIVLVMIAIVGGRIVPAFTRNALDSVVIRTADLRDRVAVGAVVAIVIADAAQAPAPALAGIAAIAGVANLIRLWGWGGSACLGRPILWVLHLAYAWLGVGLLLRAASAMWPAAVSPSAGMHALTVGAIGTMILAMMSRVALGHTGRPLRVHPLMVVGYIVMTLAALVRVVTPLVLPARYVTSLWVSSVAFAIAFAVYLVLYTRILMSPRPDGKRG